MSKGIKGFQKGHKHSNETKRKIGDANRRPIYFECDYCGKISVTKLSAYNRKKRHFCSMKCYSEFRKEKLSIEEHPRFGKGLSTEERSKRIKIRSDINHAIRDGKIKRQPCQICGKLAEVHHIDYNNPLNIVWLCRKHHWQIYENPELLKKDK